ncbi:MAG: TetR/AcrR family transcriptional regulator, partial [Gillisia sp.]
MKEKILDTATEMFLNLGFKSVTMDDIASAIGASKKTIYTHFSTKTKLVEASSRHILKKISTGINEIRKKQHNPIEEVFAIKEFVKQHLKNEKASPQFQLKKYYPKIFESLKGSQLEIM